MNQRLLSASLSVAVCIFACPALSNAEDVKLSSEGYTVSVPGDWEVIEEPKTIFTVRAPRAKPSDTFAANIRVVRYPVGQSFSVAEVLHRQKSDTGRFELIGEGKVEDAQVPMAWMAITPKSPKDESDKLVKIDFITTKGEDIVVLIAMAKRDDWEKQFAQFKKIASTFAPAAE